MPDDVPFAPLEEVAPPTPPRRRRRAVIASVLAVALIGLLVFAFNRTSAGQPNVSSASPPRVVTVPQPTVPVAMRPCIGLRIASRGAASTSAIGDTRAVHGLTAYASQFDLAPPSMRTVLAPSDWHCAEAAVAVPWSVNVLIASTAMAASSLQPLEHGSYVFFFVDTLDNQKDFATRNCLYFPDGQCTPGAYDGGRVTPVDAHHSTISWSDGSVGVAVMTGSLDAHPTVTVVRCKGLAETTCNAILHDFSARNSG